MKIIVLATKGVTTWIVVNALRAEFSDVQLIVEQPVSKFKLLKNRFAKQGFFAVFGQFLFLLSLPIFRWVNYFNISRMVSSASLNVNQPRDLSITEVETVNSVGCEYLLRSLNPDLVVVNGTRIISRNILNSCSAIFLNIHCGITPAYRGVHGGYWALASGDSGNAGVTVHTVDVGVDTGDIVYQAPIFIDSSDNFLTYPIKQYVAAIPLLLQAVNDFKTGSLRTYKRADLNSKIWFHPTLWFYVWKRITKGVR